MKEFFKYRINSILLSLLAILICSSDLVGNSWAEYVKTINEQFAFTSSNPEIEVTNKYGDVDIVSSERSDAVIEVTITVESRKESRANEMFEKIDIDFDHSGNNLSIKTEIDGWGWTNKNEKYRVDYKIYLPIRSDLFVENKYGDISLTDHSGSVEVELKYGNGNFQDIEGDFRGVLGYSDRFNLGSVHGNVDLGISYSKLSMDDADNVECDSKYSTISFGNANKAIISSSYDKYKMNNVEELRLEGKYDEITVEEVSSLTYDMNYTSLKINSLVESGYFETKYGSVSIYDISAKAKEIDISAQYTNYKLSTPNSYHLKVDTKYTGLSYPDEMNFSYRERDSNEMRLDGSLGDNPRLKINAEMKYGQLKLREF